MPVPIRCLEVLLLRILMEQRVSKGRGRSEYGSLVFCGSATILKLELRNAKTNTRRES